MIQRKLTIVLPLIAASALCATSTRAASINLALRYSGSLAADGTTPIGTPLLNTPPTHVPGAYHGFEVLMTLSDMTPTQDFQAVQFDINLDGFAPAQHGGLYSAWSGNNPWWEPIGPSPGYPIFGVNADGGHHPNDLKRIAVFATSPTGIKCRQPGEAGGGCTPRNPPLPVPFPLGTAYVQWDGKFGGGSIGLNITPNGALPWGIYDGTTPVALDASQFTMIGGSMTFTPIPEAATMTLIGIAMVGIVARRWRER
jgi:hypothetical protein